MHSHYVRMEAGCSRSPWNGSKQVLPDFVQVFDPLHVEAVQARVPGY